MSKLGQRLIRGLTQFRDAIKAGDPLPSTSIMRVGSSSRGFIIRTSVNGAAWSEPKVVGPNNCVVPYDPAIDGPIRT